MFSRWLELKNIKKSILLLGPRRAGKSTLLKLTFPSYKYVTFDDIDELQYAQTDPKGWVMSLGKKFIIDEAQRFPDIAISIKWAIDNKNVHCILTGSTGLDLFQKSTESLAGRIEILYLPPACFGEEHGEPIKFDQWKKNNVIQKEAARSLDSFIQYGGFPEVLVADTSEEKANILRNYKNTYFTRDVADLNKIENLEGLYALFQALIVGICSRYEVSSLVKETGMSTQTVKKYLNTLVHSGLLFKLYGYHLSAAKRHISSAKSYFIDTGILSSLSQDFSYAQQVENFVVSELEKRRRLGFFNCDHLYYYESTGGREVDVIIEEPKNIWAIEIKSGKTISGKDIRNLREFAVKSDKPLNKIIFHMGSDYYREDNIEVRPISTLFRSSSL